MISESFKYVRSELFPGMIGGRVSQDRSVIRPRDISVNNGEMQISNFVRAW